MPKTFTSRITDRKKAKVTCIVCRLKRCMGCCNSQTVEYPCRPEVGAGVHLRTAVGSEIVLTWAKLLEGIDRETDSHIGR